MSGSGGYKHRKRALKAKKNRRSEMAHENVARVRKQFEDKGQEWDPLNNPQQLAALNHLGRRLAQRPTTTYH